MELNHLIEGLSHPAAYPHPVQRVEIHHTHISVVFLAGSFAYKIKKPVDLGFLDFTTRDRRRHFCHEEVRLNHRLAPNVYLGVVPVTCGGEASGSAPRIEGEGDVVDWAVKMQRLSSEATLKSRIERGEVSPSALAALGEKLAGFHRGADRGEHISAWGRFEVVAGNALDNFEQSMPLVGVTLSRAVFERLRSLTEQTLVRLRPLIEERARRGLTCDTHGDLRLDHVYFFPRRKPSYDLIVIDCIEFSDRLRFADPVADMAFLVMDLRYHGRADLADTFADAYFRAAEDDEGRTLLPFFTAYRAAVRGKVEGLELAEQEIPEVERCDALARARGHWLLALGELEMPARRPCLLLVGGLPGTGKSTLARGLTNRAGFQLIRSDLIRKELAGVPVGVPAPSSFGAGIYSGSWTERTYTECLRQAEQLLFEGNRVVVDASFVQERHRRAFLERAARLRVPAQFVHCQAEPEAIRQRLHARREDASDADCAVYRQAAERWEAIGPPTRSNLWEVSTTGSQEQTLAQVLGRLGDSFLLDPTAAPAEAACSGT